LEPYITAVLVTAQRNQPDGSGRGEVVADVTTILVRRDDDPQVWMREMALTSFRPEDGWHSHSYKLIGVPREWYTLNEEALNGKQGD
jgi:hypothetical protein